MYYTEYGKSTIKDVREIAEIFSKGITIIATLASMSSGIGFNGSILASSITFSSRTPVTFEPTSLASVEESIFISDGSIFMGLLLPTGLGVGGLTFVVGCMVWRREREKV